jgi:hypothetical protein
MVPTRACPSFETNDCLGSFRRPPSHGGHESRDSELFHDRQTAGGALLSAGHHRLAGDLETKAGGAGSTTDLRSFLGRGEPFTAAPTRTTSRLVAALLSRSLRQLLRLLPSDPLFLERTSALPEALRLPGGEQVPKIRAPERHLRACWNSLEHAPSVPLQCSVGAGRCQSISRVTEPRLASSTHRRPARRASPAPPAQPTPHVLLPLAATGILYQQAAHDAARSFLSTAARGVLYNDRASRVRPSA